MLGLVGVLAGQCEKDLTTCVCACVCVSACVRARVCVYVCLCVLVFLHIAVGESNVCTVF